MSSQAIVCYLDILGFANMVSSDALTSEKPKHSAKLRAVVAAIRAIANKRNFEVHQFSDSIVIAATYTANNAMDLIESVSESQYSAACGEVLVRGGIALGQHDSDNVLLYSEALVLAYRLETSKARYPRIVLDDNILALLRGTAAPGAVGLTSARHLLVDRDNAIFVKYLDNRNLDPHERAIRTLLKDADISDPSIFEKFEWLGRYHNFELASRGAPPSAFGMPEMRALGS